MVANACACAGVRYPGVHVEGRDAQQGCVRQMHQRHGTCVAARHRREDFVLRLTEQHLLQLR